MYHPFTQDWKKPNRPILPDARKFLGTHTNWQAQTALATKIWQLEEEEPFERKPYAQVLANQKSKQQAHYSRRSEYADMIQTAIS